MGKKNEVTNEGASPALADPAELEQIEACKRALLPLAAISKRGEQIAYRPPEGGAGPSDRQFSGQYRINRLRRQAVITAADIQAARDCIEGTPTLAWCRACLKPLAKLPTDPRVEDPNDALYLLPAEDGGNVAISNAVIERAQELLG